LLFREKLIREGLRALDDYIDDERPLSVWEIRKPIEGFHKEKIRF